MVEIEYKGFFGDRVYYRGLRVYTIRVYSMNDGALYRVGRNIACLPEIPNGFYDIKFVKSRIEDEILKNREALDKIIDGVDIYGE